MKASVISRIARARIADEDKLNITDAAMVDYINTAVRYLSQVLIARKSPEMAAEETIVDYSAVPAGFHSVIGNQPCYREGEVIRSYYGPEPRVMRYWRARGGVENLDGEIFFPQAYTDVLVTAVCMLCQNKDEMDTSFEQAMTDRICSMLPGVSGGGQKSE